MLNRLMALLLLVADLLFGSLLLSLSSQRQKQLQQLDYSYIIEIDIWNLLLKYFGGFLNQQPNHLLPLVELISNLLQQIFTLTI